MLQSPWHGYEPYKCFNASILEQVTALEAKTDRYEDALNTYHTHSQKYKTPSQR